MDIDTRSISVYSKVKSGERITKDEAIIFRALLYLIGEDYYLKLKPHHYLVDNNQLVNFNSYSVEYYPTSKIITYKIGYIKRYQNEKKWWYQEEDGFFEVVYGLTFDSDLKAFNPANVISRLKNQISGHFKKGMLKGINSRLWSSKLSNCWNNCTIIKTEED